MKAHVSEKKKKIVAEFTKYINDYPVVAVVNVANIPARQMQSMRAKLRERKTLLKMTKKRLMRIAFKNSQKKGIEELSNYLEGQPALIFTSENPFKLYSELQKTKSKAPAKAGQIAPNDIVVKAGPTSFTPGPIIGQLGKFGIKTGVEKGKLVIKNDTVVAKKGEVISAELASILSRLGIEPMEIGLILTAAYEDGTIYTADVLHIDIKEYFKNFVGAHSEAFNLAIYVGYISPETIKALIFKAHNDALSLSLNAFILNDESIKLLLLKAYSQALSLSNNLPAEALPKGFRKEEKPDSEGNKKEDTNVATKDSGSKEEQKEEEAVSALGALFG